MHHAFQWQRPIALDDGQTAEWTWQEGTLVRRSGPGDLYSCLRFRGVQIYMEFNVPSMPNQSGQARDNSGSCSTTAPTRSRSSIRFRTRRTRTESVGLCTAWRRPMLMLSAAGESQTYDIIFSPRIAGRVERCKCREVLQSYANVLIQDHAPATSRSAHVEGPLIFWDHNGSGGKRRRRKLK